MYKGSIIAGLTIAAAILWAAPVLAYTSPGSPSGYVNDFAHVLKPDTIKSLDAELAAFEASSSNQIAVVTIPSMQGDYIEDYAPKLFKEWGIGKKDKDNGVLLLLSIQEHKIRIEVGYGLEGALPDSVAQKIITNDLTPNLKAGNYDLGVTTAVNDIISATQSEYQGSNTQLPKETSSGGAWYISVFIFLMVIVQFFASILARSKSWLAGGMVGAVVGVGIWAFFGLMLWWGLALIGALTAIGLLLDYHVSRTYNAAKSAGATIPWWIGGGGRGGSGGGFGGFGGGSSGGGGASGGW